MDFHYLLVRSEGGITTITVNRPQQPNALNWEAIRELRRAIAAFWTRRGQG